MKKAFIIIAMLVLVLSLAGCVVIGGSMYYPNADKYSVGNAEFSEKVEKLDIDWANGSVEVVTTEDDTVSIVEDVAEDTPDDKRVHYWLEGTTLHIKYCAPTELFRFGFTIAENSSKALTVTLPAEFALSDVTINSAAADVNVSDLSADSVNIDSASGNVSIDCEAKKIDLCSASGNITLNNGCDAESLTVESSSGKLNISGMNFKKASLSSSSGKIELNAVSAAEISVESASGSISCAFEKTPDKCGFESASGDIRLALPEDAGFKLELDQAAGSFESDFAYKKSGDSLICGSGKSEIAIESAAGDVYVISNK